MNKCGKCAFSHLPHSHIKKAARERCFFNYLTVMDIDDLRAICLSFPAAEEAIKWETVLCFMVAQKMFCTVRLDITPPRPSFKADKETFDELSQSEGFIPAPYMAHAGWVQLVNAAYISRAALEQHLRRSYELIKAKLSKKVKQANGLE